MYSLWGKKCLEIIMLSAGLSFLYMKSFYSIVIKIVFSVLLPPPFSLKGELAPSAIECRSGIQDKG